MKKVLLVLAVSLGLLSCGGKNEYKLTDTSTTKVDGKEPEWKWKTDIKKLVSHIEYFDIPEKSIYETKAEYEKKIDSIKNSMEYKKMLTDTFDMVVNNLTFTTGYDVETKTFFFLPSLIRNYDDLGVHYYKEGTKMNSFYVFNVKNKFFKESKNSEYNKLYSFPCEVDIAKKENFFKYEIYFSLADLNVKFEERTKKETITLPKDLPERQRIITLNVAIHKIEVILDNNIIFTITKDTQNTQKKLVERWISLPKTSSSNEYFLYTDIL